MAVRSPVRFRNYSRRHGALTESIEKNGLREEFISGGIFVYNRKIFDLLLGLTDFCLEKRLTARLIKDNEMHYTCMTVSGSLLTLRERQRSSEITCMH